MILLYTLLIYLNMKTNVILSSADRELFGTIIRQETKTGFLNLSDLQDSYDKIRFSQGWNERRIEHITSTQEFKERCYYVLYKQGFIKTDFKAFIEEVDKYGITKTLKQYGAWITKGARENKSVWANPYIWVMIAMEMNAKLYAEVVVWLTDQLIISRIEAGNFCKALNIAVSKFNIDGFQYAKLASKLNTIVFGRHEQGIRNTGTREQLKSLTAIEEKMAFAIDMGYIKTFENLIEDLDKIEIATN